MEVISPELTKLVRELQRLVDLEQSHKEYAQFSLAHGYSWV